MRIGFVGTGVMGKSMAGRLMAAGHPLGVYTRTKSKAADLLATGAEWYASPGALAGDSDIVFTIVGFPADVEEVYFGENGIVPNARPGCIFVDMTTSRPDLAKKIHAGAAEQRCFALDAPVSGGDTGAKNGTLSIMVGGDRDVYDRVLPLFELMGRNIVYQGEAGSGQHCKMCNQITIASNMVGVCEALAYAKKSGLDPFTVLKSISAGAAGSWTLSNLAPRILEGDFEPGFFVKHFIKDMGIAFEAAQSMGIGTPGLELALNLYRELAGTGFENDGTQGLFRLFDSKGEE